MNLQMHPAETVAINRWWLLALSLLLPLAASFCYFVAFPGTAFGNSFYTGIKIWLLTAPIAVTVLIFRERLRRETPSISDTQKSILYGIVFGIATVGLMFGLLKGTPLGDIVEDGKGNIITAIHDLGVGGARFLYFAFFISLVHSALEEFYWRWFVYGNLRHMVKFRWIAHLLAGIGFMAHHIVIVNRFFPLDFAVFLGICVGVGGIAWSLLYQRYRTLWGPWISHAIVDFSIFWIAYELIQQ